MKESSKDFLDREPNLMSLDLRFLQKSKDLKSTFEKYCYGN